MTSSYQPSRFYNMPPAATSQAGLIPYPEESSLLNQHGAYDLYRTTRAPPQPPSPKPSQRLTGPFTPDPSWGLLESDLSLKQALNSDYTHSSISARSRNRQPHTHLSKRLLVISSLFPTLAATTQLLLLLYFLDAYVSLPQSPSGGRPRISPFYSIWPYVACVGSTRLPAYKTFGIILAFLYINTFTLDLYIHHPLAPARYLRWLRLLLATVSGGSLIAVVFASADDTSHLHLYLVSIQAVSFTAVKSLTWAIDHTMRRHYPLLKSDRAAILAKRWRYAVYILAAPVGLLTVIGIYACHNTVELQTKGTACYVLVAISAICDWVYQLISVAFLLSLAYDLYQAGHYAEVRWRSEVGEGEGDGKRESALSGRSGGSGEPLGRYQRV
jgi:hypothetical protein